MSGYQLIRSTCQDSLKVIEADIQHANMLAASIPRGKSGDVLQMKLVHNQWAPLILYLLQWIDCSCSCLLPSYLNFFQVAIYKVNADDGRPKALSHNRRASIRDFYGVILPYLQRLHGNSLELDNDPCEATSLDLIVKKRMEERKKLSGNDEREDECGICLEPCTKMVLPNCCHAMCTNCYRNWNLRSESCPFCRGSIKRVRSEDLWVLTCDGDLVDKKTAVKDDILRFYLYINNLPKDIPDALFLVYYEYLI